MYAILYLRELYSIKNMNAIRVSLDGTFGIRLLTYNPGGCLMPGGRGVLLFGILYTVRDKFSRVYKLGADRSSLET